MEPIACARKGCDIVFTPKEPKNRFHDPVCADEDYNERKREKRLKKHATETAGEQGDIFEMKKIRCSRYGCEELFVPKSINHQYHSDVCASQAKSDKKLLRQIEDVDPAVVRAAESELVKEAERQLGVVQRRLLKEESRSAITLQRIDEYLSGNPKPRHALYPVRSLKKAGNGAATDCHFVFSDPQGGKWNSGIGLQALLEAYLPAIAEKIIRCVEVQRFEGPVDTFFFHMVGDIVEGCLPAGTPVLTPTGPKHIQDLKPGDSVWAHGPDGFKQRVVTAAAMTGIKPIHTVVSTERTLRASPEHPILVRRDVEVSGHASPNRHRYEVTHSYVAAQDVRAGDYLCIVDSVPDVGSTSTPTRDASVELMEFLGFYVGDGCLTRNANGEPNGVFLSHGADASYMAHYVDNCKTLFSKQKNSQDTSAVAVAPKPSQASGTRFGSVAAANEILALGFAGDSRTKRVPAWVFTLTRELRLAFLRGYLDSDGSVNKLGQVTFATVNRGLIEDIQALCQGLGILVSRIRTHERVCPLPQGGEQQSTIFVINCGSPDLNQEIGSHTPQYLDRWAQRSGTRRTRNYAVTSKGRIPAAPIGCRYSLVKSNDVGLAEPTYNISVEGLETFIADGVVTHNCAIYPGQRQHLDRFQNGDSAVDQVLTMADAICDILIARLRPYFKNFVFANAFGNHGRTGNKLDPALDKDNRDRLVAEIVKRMCSHMDIQWIIPERDRYVVESMGYSIGGIHGHQLGNKSSLNAMELPILRWDALRHFGTNLDGLVMGHRHHPASLDMNGIEVIQNGALDGGSDWFTNTTGAWAQPSQELFFVSEEFFIGTRRRLYVTPKTPRARAVSQWSSAA